jgi:hypothetical protein
MKNYICTFCDKEAISTNIPVYLNNYYSKLCLDSRLHLPSTTDPNEIKSDVKLCKEHMIIVLQQAIGTITNKEYGKKYYDD